jgi:small subunit ribosomal protein S17
MRGNYRSTEHLQRSRWKVLLQRNNMSNTGNRKVRVGIVTSSKMEKTATVLIERLVKHPLYHRVVKRSKKVVAHDENNECQIGDKVRIIETRPLSKRKRWRVVEITERAE